MKTRLLLVASLLLWPAGCADTATDPAGETGSQRVNDASVSTSLRVTLNPAYADIQTGTTVAFITVVRDSRGHHVWPEITWSSSDSTIARVSKDGLVTAVRPGLVTITASCRDGAGTARVHVFGEPPPVRGVLDWTFALAAAGLAPLYDVWGTSPSDVYAVGSSMLWDCCGTVIHYDGVTWSPMPVPPGLGELHGVWGSSGKDLFVVGWDGILHYDGVAWSSMQTPVSGSLEAVWGTSASDVYAVGVSAVVISDRDWYWRGLLLHYDGTAWKEITTPVPGNRDEWLTDVWGTSAQDVFAVGSAVLHYDGVRWTVMPTPAFEGLLTGVWGSAADDVFAVGHRGVILHYDGSTWQKMASPPRDGDLFGVWGNSSSDVFAVGDRHWWGPEGCCSDVLHYDGTTWRVEPPLSGQSLFDVWTTPDRALIVGSGPTIIHGRH